MNMKKKLILMCLAGILTVTAMIGGTLAGFHTSTEHKGVTDITVKALGIEMLGTGNTDVNSKEVTLKQQSPGSKILCKQSVRNNVEDGYTLYTRIMINKKWDDSDLDSSKIRLYAGDGEELVAGKTINNWIVWYSDAEQVVMYYTKPLRESEESMDFIDFISFETDMDNAYAGASATICFHADAVQEIAAADAMPSEWGIYPSIAENGIIFGIEE